MVNYTRVSIDAKCCAISCFSKSALGLVLIGVCLVLFDAMIAVAISVPKAIEQSSRTNSYCVVVFKIFPSAPRVYSSVQSVYSSVQSVYSSALRVYSSAQRVYSSAQSLSFIKEFCRRVLTYIKYFQILTYSLQCLQSDYANTVRYYYILPISTRLSVFRNNGDDFNKKHGLTFQI